MTAILLSGVLGALLATVANAAFQLWKEQIRHKADVLLMFIAWYEQCQGLMNRVIRYQGLKNEESIDQDSQNHFAREFVDASLDLVDLVLSQEQAAKVALLWGQGEEVKLVEAIEKHFRERVDIILEKTSPAEKLVLDIGTTKLAPIYKQLVGKMLRQASVKMIVDEAWHGK